MNKKKVLSKINPSLLRGIAHRGLHNDKYTENGMNAFSNAVRHDLPIELDIHLTKDNELVVCHDEDLKKTTGKSGIIEDLTLKEIKDNYRLLDGGEIPTLIEVMDFVNERVPLVIELKVYKKNYKALAKKLMEVLKEKVKDKKNYLLISFDPRSLWPLKKTGIIRSLLVTQLNFYCFTYFKHTVESVDMDKMLFNKRSVRNYHKRHFVNVWTIENEEHLNAVLPYTDTVTFQYMDEEIVKKALVKK